MCMNIVEPFMLFIVFAQCPAAIKVIVNEEMKKNPCVCVHDSLDRSPVHGSQGTPISPQH